MPRQAPTDPRQRLVMQIRARRALGLVGRRVRMPRPLQPDAIRLAYFVALRQLVGRVRRLVDAYLVPRLPMILERMSGRPARLDAAGDGGLEAILEEIKRAAAGMLEQRDLEELIRRIGDRTSDFQREQLARQVRARLGIDLAQLEHGTASTLADFVEQNVTLIKSIPEEYLNDVAQQVLREGAAGARAEDLADVLTERFEVAESRAQLIARDQVGKLFGSLNQVRQEALGVDSFIWRTVHDNRVREEHEALDGETFAWDAPPAEGIPGEAINCRCFAEPVLDAILEEE